MSGTLTFKAGRRERDDDYTEFNGPDGVYDMTLVKVGEPYEAESTFTKTGTQTYRQWTFAVSDSGPHDGQVLDIRTTVSMSDKSKQFEVVTALIGRNPKLGAPIDIDRDLVGRSVQAHIATNDNDFPYIKTLMPAKGSSAPAAKSEPAKAADDDSLPF